MYPSLVEIHLVTLEIIRRKKEEERRKEKTTDVKCEPFGIVMLGGLIIETIIDRDVWPDDDDEDDDDGGGAGPRFALHCVGALLLPTLQAWLRRPITSANTACWDTTTVANFKHYTGLCVDLVVELVLHCTGSTFHRILYVTGLHLLVSGFQTDCYIYGFNFSLHVVCYLLPT